MEINYERQLTLREGRRKLEGMQNSSPSFSSSFLPLPFPLARSHLLFLLLLLFLFSLVSLARLNRLSFADPGSALLTQMSYVTIARRQRSSN